MLLAVDPFPTIGKLAEEVGASWPLFQQTAASTEKTEKVLQEVLQAQQVSGRLLDTDSSLVLCGSFARYEMDSGSDCDWTLLINGVVNNEHAKTARLISRTIKQAEDDKRGLIAPGTSGTFGNLAFSHNLVHLIGGGADSNENLTRRVLLLLESRPLSLSSADSSKQVWEAVLHSILERYFEEEVHFSLQRARRVPRFLLNDLTRYWRTITVDYAAKHREQDGRKWAIRNAKLRFSRKLLYAASLGFCFDCELDPPPHKGKAISSEYKVDDFINSAMEFAKTPPLEYLARFIDSHVKEENKRRAVIGDVFGSYNEWLTIIGNPDARSSLERLKPAEAGDDSCFKKVRDQSKQFSRGLKFLFFNRVSDTDPIANLSLEYVGF